LLCQLFTSIFSKGAHNISNSNEVSQQIHKVVQIHAHPDYYHHCADYDVALLELATELEFNANVSLPSRDDLKGGNCTAIGWGQLGFGKLKWIIVFVEVSNTFPLHITTTIGDTAKGEPHHSWLCRMCCKK